MLLQAGHVFKLAAENPWTPGCTISTNLSTSAEVPLSVFALAPETSISEETYAAPKFWMVAAGGGAVMIDHSETAKLAAGDLYITPADTPVGIRTDGGIIYTELSLGKDTHMNPLLKSGNVFQLKDLLPYQDGKIVNMNLIDEDHLMMAVMSFTKGTGLSEHAAPGEALIFALDGEAVITYEGEDHLIRAGENFKFDAGGKHAVTADGPFKMALLLTK
ncbi:cupin domain-containing protein [Pseudoramibacter porci]|uniref:Cupin domain-containing protein n=1 Tax=Pseudoramibacter porci TaxID=2606631 RepID=A0A7X2NF16_9FIRM|nr:cupin domain-containing protein [Pseudoramibacter porci]MSS19392.1 cupin domain-containing protein [Pseudoramibacter porci]